MRILMLHNRYRYQGGEERAVGDIADLLVRHGHVVEVLERSSGSAGRVRAARSLAGGGLDAAEVASACRRMRADVVHAHNVHPLFGWRALAAARREGARTVLHLHNFRLFCAIAVAYRDGAPCFRCRHGHTVPGLRLRCRGSLAEAAVYAVGLHRQLEPLCEQADRLIGVSTATVARLESLGLPPGRAVALPNFVPSASIATASRAHRGAYALVAGRLVEEKGFDTAIAAARRAGVPLVVAGAGPDEPRLRLLAAGGDVRFTGWLDAQALSEARSGAAVVLVPSRWEEPCPYSVLDAFAAGVPVLASDRGGLPELADEPLPADDVDSWAGALDALWQNPARRRDLGELALARAREELGEDRYHEQLLAAYR
jgi:glycosyltransferase involved in cell wall biosynthesis